jgi:membrane associated rhomboid family serine protease
MRENADRPHALGIYPGTIGLIVANVAMFVLPLVIVSGILPHVSRVEFDMGDLQRILGVVPERAIGSGWIWQFFTYSFLHDPSSPLHLVFNMVALYFFGTEVEGLYGTRRFLALYMGGAVMAGIVFCADYGLGMPAIGASGAVYAVMVVFAIHFPRRVIQVFALFFFIPIEAWLLVSIAILLDTSSYLYGGSRDGVAHLAHLGGCLAGWLFYRYGGRLEALADRVEASIDQREKQAEEDLDQALDRVLEKINKSGMGSLSREEKKILERASKRFRQRSP